jgi:ribosome-associated toxin RatA of RatAB toxin-antitoxin module
MTPKETVLKYRQIKGDYRLHDGMWHLRAQGKKTHIHYSLHIDLGKPLPKWVINIFTKDALRETVTKVTERAR